MRTAALLFLIPVALAVAQPTQQELIAQAESTYAARVESASRELSAARKRVADEKAPVVKDIRALEEQIITLETEISRLEIDMAEIDNNQKRVFKERDAINRNLTYVATVGSEGLKVKLEALAPGENVFLADALIEALRKFETSDSIANARNFISGMNLLLQEVGRALGGHSGRGQALVNGTSDVVDGTFIFVGPESFFRPNTGDWLAGVRKREGALLPIAVTLPSNMAIDPEPVLAGAEGVLPLDASGGKALQLKNLEGGVWDEVKKGGIVGQMIVALGALAVLIAVLKMIDLARLAVDDPAKVRPLVTRLANGDTSTVAAAVPQLRRTTQELFQTGLAHFEKPKELLEEHLLSFVMRQRLHFERRLPLLAVIVTAAPLMGLLGTVTGMVKTFTLITVFGTGSASRLSSGISEALVTTMLGLVVAIPVLILHGFLSHRIHKSLALVERFAHEFAVAAEDAKFRQKTTSEMAAK